jgi:hypothetical protein
MKCEHYGADLDGLVIEIDDKHAVLNRIFVEVANSPAYPPHDILLIGPALAPPLIRCEYKLTRFKVGRNGMQGVLQFQGYYKARVDKRIEDEL